MKEKIMAFIQIIIMVMLIFFTIHIAVLKVPNKRVCLVNKISYVFKEPQPGDTVLYKNQEIKIKKVDGSVLQTNIGNSRITMVNKTIGHTQAQALCHIIFRINRH